MTLLKQSENHFRRYLAIDPRLPLVLALWSLATHVFEAFDAFPYLAVTSPTPRCGKTRVAELLELVCKKPVRTVGMSVAVLFRTVEQDQPTLIADEAENLRGKDDLAKALVQVLNAGYRKGQTVRRCEGGNGASYRMRDFRTYCPKVFVLIGNVSNTLADRSIFIRMRRRLSTDKIERFRFARAKTETADLRAAIEEWAKDERSRIEEQYNEMDLAFLEDREAELWLPLFSVCAVSAPERLAELEAAAKDFAGSKADDEPTDLSIKLLVDVREIFERRDTDRLSTVDLLKELNADEESPWATLRHGHAMNANGLSGFLRPFGIRSKNLRTKADKVVKGYERRDFSDVWETYLPSPSSSRYTATEAANIGESGDLASATEGLCSGSQSAPKPNIDRGCSDVAG